MSSAQKTVHPVPSAQQRRYARSSAWQWRKPVSQAGVRDPSAALTGSGGL